MRAGWGHSSSVPPSLLPSLPPTCGSSLFPESQSSLSVPPLLQALLAGALGSVPASSASATAVLPFVSLPLNPKLGGSHGRRRRGRGRLGRCHVSDVPAEKRQKCMHMGPCSALEYV
eukprot:3932943-Rhodomonas_salina.2